MKIAIILWPGLNRYHEIKHCLAQLGQTHIDYIWHEETEVSAYDLIILPGGFSYGDAEGAGTIAARSPIMAAIQHSAKRGVPILGICNGFQILTQAELLPGQLIKNKEQKFICKKVELEITNNHSRFTQKYHMGQKIKLPIAHMSGRYVAAEASIEQLKDNNQIIMRYLEPNFNGSEFSIAGIINKAGNICGIMPHPENYFHHYQGGIDGQAFFASMLG